MFGQLAAVGQVRQALVGDRPADLGVHLVADHLDRLAEQERGAQVPGDPAGALEEARALALEVDRQHRRAARVDQARDEGLPCQVLGPGQRVRRGGDAAAREDRDGAPAGQVLQRGAARAQVGLQGRAGLGEIDRQEMRAQLGQAVERADPLVPYRGDPPHDKPIDPRWYWSHCSSR